jgi:hypothetical protein
MQVPLDFWVPSYRKIANVTADGVQGFYLTRRTPDGYNGSWEAYSFELPNDRPRVVVIEFED